MTTNWYEKLPKHLKQDNSVDKHYKNHMIKPRSMITCIAPTGGGKTNALVDFLNRKNESFYQVILFNPVSVDEPLYNLMKEKMPEIQIFTDINELPELDSFPDEENKEEKLIIFDDFINLKPKEMKKINKYLTGGRKKGFSCWSMVQNYTSCPKIITRNTHYFLIYKLNDTHTISNVLKNHNVNNIDKDKFRKMYVESTKEPLSFFLVDLKDENTHLRKGWTDIFKD